MQAKVCLCLPRLESLSPQPSGRPIIKSHWPSSSDSLGIPSPFVDSQAEKPGVGFRTFTIVRELLWYHCSPVCGFTHPGGVRFDFTVNAPLLPPHCGFYFVFGRGVSYSGVSSIRLLMAVQQLIAILVLLQEKMCTRPSTLPS